MGKSRLGNTEEGSNNEGGRGRLGASVALLAVLVTPALLMWAWSRPMAVAPREMPPLSLSPTAVSARLAEEARLAATAPEGEDATARARRFAELNQSELDARDTPGQAAERRRRLLAATNALIREHGEEVLGSMRAADLRDLEPALRGRPSQERAVEVLGGFLRMMERYGMMADGRQRAPAFVVRATWLARWNAMHGRPLTEGFATIDLQAYWGWLALGAENAPAERRLEALENYAAAGGRGADEARGVLLLEAGLREEAREAFLAGYEASPSFRLRNHLLAATEDPR